MERMRPKVGSAVLVEKDGKFLLGKRNKANYRNYWVIPGGGVKWGESIRDAGIREIKEETGLDIEIVKFIGHKEVMNLPGNYHTVVFFHLARPVNGEIRATDDLSDARFFSIEELREMDNVADSAISVFESLGVWKG